MALNRNRKPRKPPGNRLNAYDAAANEPVDDHILFPNLGRWAHLWGPLPGTLEDFEAQAGYTWLNPVVQAAQRWLGDNFFEATFAAVRGKGKGKGKPVDSHPVVSLMANPNPYYDASALWKATILSDASQGDAYWLKVRDHYGRVSQVVYLYHEHVVPVSEYGEYISFYEYRPLYGVPVQRFEVADVIHFRNGLDPIDVRHGLSPMRSVLREIVTDNSASTYSAAILKNMGASAYVIHPADANTRIAEDQQQVLKKKIQRATGDGAGDPIISTSPIAVTRIGLSPENMRLDKSRNFPEDRILAVLGLNSIALGLTSGAAHKTYANYEQAVKACYENCLIPMQSRFAATLNTQLLPEFDENPNVSLRFVYDDVAALKESQDAVTQRVTALWTSNIIDRSEARSLLGYEPRPEDVGAYFSGQQVVVPLTT